MKSADETHDAAKSEPYATVCPG